MEDERHSKLYPLEHTLVDDFEDIGAVNASGEL